MLALGVLTDGRADYLAESMETVHRLGDFDYRFIVDDSGLPEYASWLRCNYPDFKVIRHETRRGLAGAVQSVWEHALETGAEFLFHLEDDFLILDNIDVPHAAQILGAYPDVAQMLYKRQPLTPAEHDDITDAMGVLHLHDVWVSQNHIFSLNPCLIPRWVLERGWPEGNEAEQSSVMRRAGIRFGVWDSPAPLVHHIGESRSSGWRL